MKRKIGYVMAYKNGHNNYGTSLQGYALLYTLEHLGYNVEIINYKKKMPFLQKVAWVVNAIRVGEMKELMTRIYHKKNVSTNEAYAENMRIRTESVDKYKRDRFYHHFKDFIGYKALHEGSRDYDAVVVGSDQVWTPMGLPTRFYNLLFVDERVKKIAYASSFGVSSIPAFQQTATGRYLDRFYRIGVREIRGKEIVDNLSHQKATVVADPTLLLTKQDWENEINTSLPSSSGRNKLEEGYIFCYFLGTNKDARNAANKLKEITGLKIVCIRHMDEYVESDEFFGDFAPYDVDPNDFVRLISKATYVCTDSFHCSVFSSIFHRQFMTFYRFSETNKTGRNSRIDSLFEELSIPRSHIYSGDINEIKTEINWDKVDERVARLRTDSLLFLKQSLES